MLKLPGYMLTTDPNLDQCIMHFVSARLYDMIEPMRDYYLNDLKLFFPPRYRRKKMLPVIEDFCALLKSDQSYIPPLIMEYVLYYSLHYEIDRCQSCNESTISIIPQHNEILIFLKNTYPKLDDPEDYLLGIEDLEMYPDTCFWDHDFRFLDAMTENQLYHAKITKDMGIGDKESIIYVPGSVTY